MAGKEKGPAYDPHNRYRVNGGPEIPEADMEWGKVFPWDEVEFRCTGTPWHPIPPEPPVLCSTDPKIRSTLRPDGRYYLEAPIWPRR